MTVPCPVCCQPCQPVGIRNGFHIHRCTACRHLFVHPLPAEPLAIYAETYFTGGNHGFGYVDYDRDKEPMVASFEQYLTAIQAHLPRKGRLLDIGAATGFFLAIAQRRGWLVNGVEPSDYAASAARGKGLAVRTGVLSSNEEPADVVTALDVIEHVPDPRAFVQTVRSVLPPGGLFAINTPDSGSAIARLLGVHWHAVLPPEHIQLFNRRSLGLLLDQEGFDLLETLWIGKKFTAQYVVQTLSRWTELDWLSTVANRLKQNPMGRIELPLNLHDNLFVLAKRR